MMTEWRVYGCGSASSSKFLQTSYELAEGKTRLNIDFGNGAFYRRCQYEGDVIKVLDSIKHLFITHGHADHIVDLARHMVAWRYTPGYEPIRPTHLYGTAETFEHVKHLLDGMGINEVFQEAYKLHEFDIGDSFAIDDFVIETYPAQHIPGSCAVKVTTKEQRKIMFTGDTSWFEALPEQCIDNDLLIAEASFIDVEHIMHLNLNEISSLAKLSNPKAMLLVHLYPELENLSDEQIKSTVNEHYEGQVFVGQDGMKLVWDDDRHQWTVGRLF